MWSFSISFVFLYVSKDFRHSLEQLQGSQEIDAGAGQGSLDGFRPSELESLMSALKPEASGKPVELTDEAAWGKLAGKLWSTGVEDTPHKASSSKHLPFFGAKNSGVFSRGKLPRWVEYSAAVLIVVTFAVWGRSRIHGSGTEAVEKVYATKAGQRASVVLPDGSKVTLAPATKLRVIDRHIELQGEAVFVVTQNSGTPFIVKTGNTITRVLGTTFGVRRYSTDASLRVAVADGRVAVSSAVLSSGDVVAVTDTSIHVSHNANVGDLLAWSSGRQPRLVFQNEPVFQVLAQLERWYNVKFAGVDAELKHDMLSTTIEDTQLTPATLDLLGAALGRRLERRGQTIYILTP